MSSIQFDTPLLEGCSAASKMERGDDNVPSNENERGEGASKEGIEKESLLYKTPSKKVPILERIFSNGTSSAYKKKGQLRRPSRGRERRPRGLAYSWGWNNNGQLGHNDVISRISKS